MKPFDIYIWTIISLVLIFIFLLLLFSIPSDKEDIIAPERNEGITISCDQDIYTLQELATMMDYLKEKELTGTICDLMMRMHLRAS